MQKLRHSRGEVEDGAVNVELVHVARDGSGQQALRHRFLRRVEREASGAVADVEVDARVDRCEDLVENAPFGGQNAAFAAPEAMGDDVAGFEQLQDFRHARMGAADVDHEREVDGVGGLTRATQGFEVVLACDVAGQADLDAEDRIAMALDGLRCEIGVGIAQIEELAPGVVGRERGLADDGDVEQREDARIGDVDDVLAQAGEGVGARGAGVDDRGHAFGDTVGIGRNTERSDAVIDMDVDIDPAGRDDAAGGVDDMEGVGGGDRVREPRDLAVRDGDVLDLRQPLSWIDDASAFHQQVIYVASAAALGEGGCLEVGGQTEQ